MILAPVALHQRKAIMVAWSPTTLVVMYFVFRTIAFAVVLKKAKRDKRQ